MGVTSQLWTTGAIHFFLGVGGGGSATLTQKPPAPAQAATTGKAGGLSEGLAASLGLIKPATFSSTLSTTNQSGSGGATATLQLPRTPAYLGTCEGSPSFDIIPQYSDVQEDRGGDVPTDVVYHGRRGIISADFTRWNDFTYARAVTTNPFGALPRGADDSYDIGTLMQREGYTYTLFAIFPASIKAPYAGQPIGYRFPSVYLDRESLHTLGSRPKKVRLVWHALRVFVPQPIALIFPPPPKTPPLSTTPQVPSMLHGDSRDDRLAEERKIQAEANRKANEKAAEEVARRQRAEAKKLRDLTKSLLSSMTGSYVLYDFNIPSNLVVE